ncbi:MAG: hypothetical protein EXS16_15235 [Gemmataceae bacterium]|nr:hypothetical protein [Gemmataceae bacterium]
MRTLVIDNVPASLYDRIQKLATIHHRTPSDTALEVLESAFRTRAPLPQAPFLTGEICSPFNIP